jgi:hypothetical protein
MRWARFVTRPSHINHHIERMDIVYIVLGIAMFAVLLLLIEGIDRV